LAGHVASLEDIARTEVIQYVEFPEALKGKYQSYTQADLSALRAVGCDHQFADVHSGVTKYLQKLST
jgi:ADP-L-glycero-D-manno-heptose 6-epimerase